MRQINGLLDSDEGVEVSDLKASCVTGVGEGFFCGTTDGFLWESNTKRIFGPIHTGWIIRVECISYAGKEYFISCGGDDRVLKIYEFDSKKWADLFSSKEANIEK